MQQQCDYLPSVCVPCERTGTYIPSAAYFKAVHPLSSINAATGLIVTTKNPIGSIGQIIANNTFLNSTSTPASVAQARQALNTEIMMSGAPNLTMAINPATNPITNPATDPTTNSTMNPINITQQTMPGGPGMSIGSINSAINPTIVPGVFSGTNSPLTFQRNSSGQIVYPTRQAVYPTMILPIGIPTVSVNPDIYFSSASYSHPKLPPCPCPCDHDNHHNHHNDHNNHNHHNNHNNHFQNLNNHNNHNNHHNHFQNINNHNNHFQNLNNHHFQNHPFQNINNHHFQNHNDQFQNLNNLNNHPFQNHNNHNNHFQNLNNLNNHPFQNLSNHPCQNHNNLFQNHPFQNHNNHFQNLNNNHFQNHPLQNHHF